LGEIGWYFFEDIEISDPLAETHIKTILSGTSSLFHTCPKHLSSKLSEFFHSIDRNGILEGLIVIIELYKYSFEDTIW
jgi:hypothetical protein